MWALRRGQLGNPAAMGGAFSPADLGSTLILWLKADALSLNDGDSVSPWTDSSGNGNSATVPVGTLTQPKFKTNIVNGKPVVRFNGGSGVNGDVLQVNVGFNSAHTFIYAAKHISFPNSYNGELAYCDTTTTLSSGNVGSIYQRSSGHHALYPHNNTGGAYDTGNSASGDYALAEWFVFTLPFSAPATWTARKNGAAENSGTSTAYVAGIVALQIAATQQVGQDRACNIDIAELIACDSLLSSANIQLCERYLGAKYGITVA